MLTLETTAVEQIGRCVESWNDGWTCLRDDERGNRIRLIRQEKPGIQDELEIHSELAHYYLFVRRQVTLANGRPETVSAPMRNEELRRAIDFINNQLDDLGAYDSCAVTEHGGY